MISKTLLSWKLLCKLTKWLDHMSLHTLMAIHYLIK